MSVLRKVAVIFSGENALFLRLFLKSILLNFKNIYIKYKIIKGETNWDSKIGNQKGEKVKNMIRNKGR